MKTGDRYGIMTTSKLNYEFRMERKMKAIVCELCGSNDIVKQGDFFVCQHCGTKYTTEEAKKLIGTVRIDKSEEAKKALVLARRARENANSENAQKFYGIVMQEDPDNWEASFFHAYYQATQCTMANIIVSANTFKNSLDSNLRLVKALSDENEVESALSTVVEYSKKLVDMFSVGALKNYADFKDTEGALDECLATVVVAGEIYNGLEKGFKQYFPSKTAQIIKLQKMMYDNIRKNAVAYKDDYLDQETTRLIAEIKKFDSTYSMTPIRKSNPIPSNAQQSKTGRCYIATSIYGSYDCPEVWTLRRFRDCSLSKTWYGKAFIYTYYAVSPTLVKWFGETKWFRNMWKPKLDRMVKRLKSKGFADTPYQDRNW